ncbi:MAG: hypothetical protein PHW69_04215 [Elusimicrobiaceae bacterium]|nr:hypothetical protein [Elusimicrobiaceae bacterium]
MARKTDIATLLADLKDNVWLVLSMVQTKGIGHFKLPLLTGFVLFFFSYSTIYKPIRKGHIVRKARIESLEAQSQYASAFQETKASLDSFTQRLPKMSSKDDFLGKTINDLCNDLHFVPDSINAPRETVISGLTLSSVGFRLRVPFKSAGEIIARLENSPKYIAITEARMAKTEVMGMVDLSVTVTTIFY